MFYLKRFNAARQFAVAPCPDHEAINPDRVNSDLRLSAEEPLRAMRFDRDKNGWRDGAASGQHGRVKVTKYFTATGTNTEDLDRSVNSMIQKGYQPFGNAYDVVDGPICQAMVKVEEAPPPENKAQVA